MTKLIIVALRALQKAADKSAARAADKQVKFKKLQRSEGKKLDAAAADLRKQARLLVAQAERAEADASRHHARAEVGHSVLSADKSAAESLSTAIKSITEA